MHHQTFKAAQLEMLRIFPSYWLPVVFTTHFLPSPLILLSVICSRELSFAVTMKIPLPFGIMIKTLPKFSRHIHLSQASQLCAENMLALFVNETRQRQGKTGQTHSSLLAQCLSSIALLSLKLTGEHHWSSCSCCGNVLPQGHHFSLSQAPCSLVQPSLHGNQSVCSLLYACDHTFPPRYSALLSLCSTGL